MGKPSRKSEAGAPLWYVSYGDMVTNMLCFFVMLFSFSTLDSPRKRLETQTPGEKFTAVFSINREQGAHQWLTKGNQGIALAPKSTRSDIPRIVRRVRRLLQTVKIREQILVVASDRMVRIRIPSKVLFESGAANLMKESEEVLLALMPIVSEETNDIRIDGHTDDLPIRSASFPSNWELSTARACSVVRFYTERLGLEATRFSAQGFADTRPQVPNTTAANREINRRIEMNIMTTKRRKHESYRWSPE